MTCQIQHYRQYTSLGAAVLTAPSVSREVLERIDTIRTRKKVLYFFQCFYTNAKVKATAKKEHSIVQQGEMAGRNFLTLFICRTQNYPLENLLLSYLGINTDCPFYNWPIIPVCIKNKKQAARHS